MNLPAVYDPQGNGAPVMAYGPADSQPEDRAPTIGLLVTMIRRRKAVLLLTLAVCIALAAVVSAARQPIYRASADVMMLTRGTDVVPHDTQGTQDQPRRTEDVETRIALVRSREAAGQVLDAAGLLRDRAFVAQAMPGPRYGGGAHAGGGANAGGGATGPGPREVRDRAVGLLTSRVRVERLGNAFTLRIAYDDPDPARAALVANTYARLFTTDEAREKAHGDATATRVLASRLEELRASAKAAFAQVQDYRIGHGLLGAAATGLTEQEISAYNQQIALARAEASRDAAALASARRQLGAGGADAVGEATGSSVVTALRAQRAQLVTREGDLSQRYFDTNPDLVTVRQQISDIDRQIASEVSRTIHGLETNAAASSQRLSSLLASRAGTRAQLGTDNAALVQFEDLQKRAEAAQALYQTYLERYNEVVAGTGAEQPTARLISAAQVPALPVAPDVPLNLALGGVAGLVLGAILAVAAEMTFRGVTTLEDVERRTSIRALGYVPLCRTVDAEAPNPLDAVVAHPDGPFAEALRNVIVSVRHAMPGPCRAIAVTSAVPGEGKSTLAACMGRALALAGEKVVVVDCDAVRPQLGRLFGLSDAQPGMAQAFDAPAGQAVQYRDEPSGMRLIPITRPLGKGARLTERGRLRQLVARLREEFDVVILDCPPILPIAETREILTLADTGVVVVRWRRTADVIVRAAIRQLPLRTIGGLGAVLNMVDMNKQARFGGTDPATFYAHYREYYA